MHPEGERRTSSGGYPWVQRCLIAYCGGALVLALPIPAPASLPRSAAVAAVVIAGLLLVAAILSGGRRRWLVWAALPLGLAWSGLAQERALAARLQVDESGTTVTFTARVQGEPKALRAGPGGPPGLRFEAGIQAVHQPGIEGWEGRQVRLTWYGAPPVRNGDLWRMTAVLRSPWSYANPGGFDYERWLLASGLQATGYVRQGVRLQPGRPGIVSEAREALRASIGSLELNHGAVLQALLVGRNDGISDARWETFRTTGTVHLMVISGLHVSLAAGLGFLLGRVAGRHCPLLPLWVHARVTGCVTGAATALAYVALAGAGLPALRALVMSTITLAFLAGGRTQRLGGALLVALTVLLTLRPLAIHQQGFWLSFGAVGILYLALGHRHGGSRIGGLLRAQLALSLGMLPLVAAGTGTVPWMGIAANLVAVPVMSLVAVPAVLVGGGLALISATAAGWALRLADAVIGAVLHWLEWLALVPAPVATGNSLSLAVAQVAVLSCLAGLPGRWLPLAAMGLVLPLAAPFSGLAHGEFRVMALDVGQGTAVAVDTRRHRLLYDAGPGFPGGFETGSAVVVPSLAATGAAALDVLVLSHDDIDHVGGAPFVRKRLRPRAVVGSLGRAGVRGCHGGQWRWDGVRFELLAVERPEHPADNDRSCILLVQAGRQRMLIGGDISARVEARLLRALARHPDPLALMFAPHHGSATSSSRALLRVARPALVVVSAGRGNRFGHPHPQVVDRYRQLGARLFQTGRDGALIWHSRLPGEMVRWRRDRGPYWRSRAPAGASSRR